MPTPKHLAGLISTNYLDGEAPYAFEWANMVLALDTQPEGALAAVGAGVISGLAVSVDSGLLATVGAGHAVIDTTNGHCYVLAETDLSISVPDDAADVYIWVCALFTPPEAVDSRTSAALRIVVTEDSADPPNSLPLAHGSSSGGVFTLAADDRTFCPARQGSLLATSVANLWTAVGAGYANPASLDSRVSSLEATGGSPDAGFRIWKNMPYDVADPTTPEQMMTTKIAAHVTALHGEPEAATPDVVIEPHDTDAVNQALALLQDIATDNVQAGATQVDSVIIVPGYWGDSSNSSPDFVDRVNSTWLTGLATP